MSFFDQLGALLAKYDVVGAFWVNVQLFPLGRRRRRVLLVWGSSPPPGM